MNAVEVKESQEEIDYSEAAHVDEEHEYYLKTKIKGLLSKNIAADVESSFKPILMFSCRAISKSFSSWFPFS
jgi:hypothetical protein